MAKYTHFRGVHFSWPFRYRKSTGDKFNLRFKFSQQAKYLLLDNDQWDWNKLWGYKLKYFSPMEQSFMIGWRYNPDKDLIEFNAYGHNNSDRQMSKVLGTCKVEEWAEVTISVENSKVVFRTRENEAEIIGKYTGKKWRINPWFGGQKKAPHNMCISIIEK